MKTVKEVGKELSKFIDSVVGNRVFDIYLKYMGIKILNSATLVPFALIMGRDAFKEFMKIDMPLKAKQIKSGGGIINNIKDLMDYKLPVIDNKLFGTYLKLTGLAAVNLTPSTLIPLGVLMSVYHMYNKDNKKNKLSSQRGGGSLKEKVESIVGNRVLDVYLKYMGIKLLNSATLVPFAIIMGRDALQEYIFNDKKQKGGKIPDKIPIFDDPLFGSYLKFMGLTALDVSMNTFVPLGLLMVLYDLYINNSDKSKK